MAPKPSSKRSGADLANSNAPKQQKTTDEANAEDALQEVDLLDLFPTGYEEPDEDDAEDDAQEHATGSRKGNDRLRGSTKSNDIRRNCCGAQKKNADGEWQYILHPHRVPLIRTERSSLENATRMVTGFAQGKFRLPGCNLPEWLREMNPETLAGHLNSATDALSPSFKELLTILDRDGPATFLQSDLWHQDDVTEIAQATIDAATTTKGRAISHRMRAPHMTSQVYVGLGTDPTGSITGLYVGRSMHAGWRAVNHLLSQQSGTGLHYSEARKCTTVRYLPVITYTAADHATVAAVAEWLLCWLLGTWQLNEAFVQVRSAHGLPRLTIRGWNSTPCLEAPRIDRDSGILFALWQVANLARHLGKKLDSVFDDFAQEVKLEALRKGVYPVLVSKDKVTVGSWAWNRSFADPAELLEGGRWYACVDTAGGNEGYLLGGSLDEQVLYGGIRLRLLKYGDDTAICLRLNGSKVQPRQRHLLRTLFHCIRESERDERREKLAAITRESLRLEAKPAVAALPAEMKAILTGRRSILRSGHLTTADSKKPVRFLDERQYEALAQFAGHDVNHSKSSRAPALLMRPCRVPGQTGTFRFPASVQAANGDIHSCGMVLPSSASEWAVQVWTCRNAFETPPMLLKVHAKSGTSAQNAILQGLLALDPPASPSNSPPAGPSQPAPSSVLLADGEYRPDFDIDEQVEAATSRPDFARPRGTVLKIKQPTPAKVGCVTPVREVTWSLSQDRLKTLYGEDPVPDGGTSHDIYWCTNAWGLREEADLKLSIKLAEIGAAWVGVKMTDLMRKRTWAYIQRGRRAYEKQKGYGWADGLHSEDLLEDDRD